VSGTAERILILGGGGMVGLQVAREAARKLDPETIVISALSDAEVSEAVAILEGEASREGWRARFLGESGDIFVHESLRKRNRRDVLADPKLFDVLFDDIFSSNPDAYKGSALFQLVEKYKPDVIIDCINTATAISYQDVFTTSHKVKVKLEQLENAREVSKDDLQGFLSSVRELLIAQGVPQITRHILFLHRTLSESEVRVYVKVGTTGTGGMGVNIPYTHSEEKPSPTLLSKSAIGFAQTGLLFLLARTPGLVKDSAELRPTMIKEIKPGAMIGFKRLGATHVKVAGPDGARRPGVLLEPREESLGDAVDPRDDFAKYAQLDGKEIPIRIVGADTGENGFFSIGEFQAITYPRQMEYVTPEEVARTVVMEILGSSTGRDVIAAIDGAITEPSYRAGALRHHACREMERLEEAFLSTEDDALPSIAVGQLGPPKLSKLLIEAWLLRAAAGTSSFDELIAINPATMREKVEEWLAANPRITSLITTIGIPILREKGGEFTLTRGPRLNIPVPLPDGSPVPLDSDVREHHATSGWVDLRSKNFEAWHTRLQRLRASRPKIAEEGSAAFERAKYMDDQFRPGDVVGWVLTNETDEQGMVGHRIL